MVISSDGTVYPCCYWNSYNNTGNPACGNTNEQTLDEIWNGEVYRNLRRNMAAGDLEAAGCANCLAIEQGATLNLRWNRDVKAEKPRRTAYALNMAQKRKEIRNHAEVLESTPTVISLTPSEQCNLRCLHCYQDATRGTAIRRGELTDEVLSLVPTLSEMIAGGGEPLLLPIWRRFITEHVSDTNPYLQFSMSTNATHLTDSILDGLASFAKLAIIVSFDGATADVYERVRVRGDYGEVVANIDTLVELVRSNPESRFALTYCVMRDNMVGLPDLLRFCIERELAYNLMPVMTWPIDQSIRCFNNPSAELPVWRTAIHEARQLFESEYVPIMDLVEPEVDGANVPWFEGGELLAARGHFDALEAAIPWGLLDVEHHPIDSRVPESIFGAVTSAVAASHEPAVTGDRLHQVPYFGSDLLVAIRPVRDATAGEVEYFAPIGDDGTFQVHLPAGEWECMPCPRNQAPGQVALLSWRLHVAHDGEVEVDLSGTNGAAGEVTVAIRNGFQDPLWGLDWATAPPEPAR